MADIADDIAGTVTHPTRRPLVALLAADGISVTGSMLTALAVPWFVLVTTGSAARTGLTAALEAVAVVVAGFLGGPLVDRIGHRRASVLSDIGAGSAIALIPALAHAGVLAFWTLLVLVFAATLIAAPGVSARRGLYAVVARRAEVGLERTNTLAMTVIRAGGLLGPLLAGVLIAAVGATNVLWLDAATFLVSAALVAFGVPAVPREHPAVGGGPRAYGRQVLDGLRFLWSDRPIFWLEACSALGSLLAEPIYSVVLPVYARERFGSSTGLGVMFAALAAGSLVGNGLYFVFAPRLPRRATILVGFGGRALAFWLLIPLPPLAVVAGIIAVEAVLLEPVNPLWATVMQERVPAELQGRVFGAMRALGAAAGSVGLLAYGLLLDRIGLRDTLVVLAAVNLAVPLAFWLAPRLDPPAERRGQPVTD